MTSDSDGDSSAVPVVCCTSANRIGKICGEKFSNSVRNGHLDILLEMSRTASMFLLPRHAEPARSNRRTLLPHIRRPRVPLQESGEEWALGPSVSSSLLAATST